jgi:hypothetical protein
MSEFGLVIIGHGPVATLALAMAIADRGEGRVHAVSLEPQQIAGFALSAIEQFPPESTEVFAAIGPAALSFARYDLWAKLKLGGYRFATLVHRWARCDPSAKLAENVLVGAGSVVDVGTDIGRGSILGSGTVVGVGTKVDQWCWLASGVVVGANASIGPHVVLGMGVNIADGANIKGPCEIDVAGTYRGEWAPGTFISHELPMPGARLVRS